MQESISEERLDDCALGRFTCALIENIFSVPRTN